MDLPQGDRRLQVRPPRRPPEHPARLREPAQRPPQPGRARRRSPSARLATSTTPRRIEDASFRDLVSVDLFEETDQKIISDLARAVAEQTVTAREVAEVVRAAAEQRVDRRLPPALHGDRQRLRAAGRAQHRSTSRCTSFDEALERYRTRLVPHRPALPPVHLRPPHRSRYPHPLDPLREQVEKRYTNKFVYELGNAWQQQVDAADRWRSSALRSQTLVLRATTSSRSSRRTTRRPSSSSPTPSATRSPTSSAHASARRTASTPTSRPSSACCRATPNSAWRRCFRTRTLEALGRRQDRARRRPADERHRAPRKILEARRRARRSRPRTSRP